VPSDTQVPPHVMGEDEQARWDRYEADRRNGVTTVGSLRDATGTVWERGT
jgi:hypothetical protein